MTRAEQREALEALIEEGERRLQIMRTILENMHNRPAKTRAPATSVVLTPQVRRTIKSLHRRNPAMPQSVIASMVGVNPGRVSEVLSGKRV